MGTVVTDSRSGSRRNEYPRSGGRNEDYSSGTGSIPAFQHLWFGFDVPNESGATLYNPILAKREICKAFSLASRKRLSITLELGLRTMPQSWCKFGTKNNDQATTQKE
jgi:hypothetical protein